MLGGVKNKTRKVFSRLINVLPFQKNSISPNYCELIVTEKCFFRCKMCNMWKRTHENQPTLIQWKKFLDSFKKTIELPYKISICGGETLTYPHLSSLIKYAKNLGFDISITTNAFLLNKKLADKLYKAGLREYVISLDSLDETTHDSIRGKKGSYKKIMEAIEILSKYRETSINLISVIMSLNVKELVKLIDWTNNNTNINSINFNAITEPLCSNSGEKWFKDSSYAYLWPESSKTKESIEKIIKLKEKENKIGNSIAQLRTFIDYYNQPLKFVKDGKCHMGNSVSINSEGFIFLCHYFGAIGNIKKDQFEEIWRSKKSQIIRKKILKLRS